MGRGCAGRCAAEEETPLDAVLEAVGAALERLEQRDNWLLWIDLATLLPPWNVPAEFQEPYFTEESPEEDEEAESRKRMKRKNRRRASR